MLLLQPDSIYRNNEAPSLCGVAGALTTLEPSLPHFPFLGQINGIFHQNRSLSLRVQILPRIDVPNQLQAFFQS